MVYWYQYVDIFLSGSYIASFWLHLLSPFICMEFPLCSTLRSHWLKQLYSLTNKSNTYAEGLPTPGDFITLSFVAYRCISFSWYWVEGPGMYVKGEGGPGFQGRYINLTPIAFVCRCEAKKCHYWASLLQGKPKPCKALLKEEMWRNIG